MTLILTWVTSNKIVQVSDRRLTFPDGAIHDDEANKAICIICYDARFVIAYTGLAYIDGKTRTDEWIVDYLTSIHAAKMTLKSLAEALQNKATDILKTGTFSKIYNGLTFILSGFFKGQPFLISISNHEGAVVYNAPKCEETEILPEAREQFDTKFYRMKSVVNPESAYLLDMHGIDKAINKPLTRRIRKLINNRFFHLRDGKTVANELVSLIRAANKIPPYGKYIGRNCMSIILTSSPSNGFIAEYHPDKISPQQYCPHCIFPDATYWDIKIWGGPDPPPWW